MESMQRQGKTDFARVGLWTVNVNLFHISYQNIYRFRDFPLRVDGKVLMKDTVLIMDHSSGHQYDTICGL